MSNLPGSKTDKRKQSLYFPESMLQEIKEEAARLDRSLSWVVQRAWKISRLEIKKLPSVNDVEGGEDDEGGLSPSSEPARASRTRPRTDVVRARVGRHAALRPHEDRGRTRAGSVHAILSDGILCDGFIWKYLWDELAAVVAARPLALPRPRAQRAAGRSRPDRHRGARRRLGACGGTWAIRRACSSATRWAARWRSRRTGSARRRCAAWCCSAAASATSRARSRASPILDLVLPEAARPRRQGARRRARRLEPPAAGAGAQDRAQGGRDRPGARCTPRTCCRTCRT